MKNKATIWCYISAGAAYIAGIAYCLSLLFLPIGIYCIIYGNRFLAVSRLTDSQLAYAKQALLIPTIFTVILAFPIGLIALVPYFMAGASNVTVSGATQSQVPPEGETVKVDVDTVTIQKEENNSDLTSSDLEKLEKLASFRRQGLLTDDEYNQAKEQLMNKK